MQGTPSTRTAPPPHRLRNAAWGRLAGVVLLIGLLFVIACGGAEEPVTRLEGDPSPTGERATASPAASVPATPGVVGERQGGITSGAVGTRTSINMTEMAFDPKEVTIPKGGEVEWVNNSAVVHTVTADPSKAANADNVALPAGVDAWDSGNVEPGESYSHTFETPGTYKYICIPHEAAGMVGTITVTP